jgi:hypothetical protein
MMGEQPVHRQHCAVFTGNPCNCGLEWKVPDRRKPNDLAQFIAENLFDSKRSAISAIADMIRPILKKWKVKAEADSPAWCAECHHMHNMICGCKCHKAEADSPKPHADTCGKTLPGGSAVSFCQDGCKCWCHAETHLDSPKPVSEEEER